MKPSTNLSATLRSGTRKNRRLIAQRSNLGHTAKKYTGKILTRDRIWSKKFTCSKILETNVVNGTTGNIQFNEEGDRVESLYEIVNIQNKQMKVVGTYRTNTVGNMIISFDLHFLF